MTTSNTGENERAVPGAHALQCMEVWGGNTAIETGLSMPGLDAWIYSEPYRAEHSGGDIHYVSMCGAGKIGRFVLADVAGHGSGVSDLAEQLRGLVRRSINRPDQTRLARGLNRAFGRLSESGVFATAALVSYFTPTDQLITCLAGHPRPLWYRAAEDTWRLLGPEDGDAEAGGGLPLGIIPRTEYTQFAVTLERGDLVLVYSDALIEGGAEHGRGLGEDGLLALARTLDARRPDDLGRALIQAVDRHSGESVSTRGDDLTLFVFHHNASDPPTRSLGEKARVLGRMLGL